MKTYMQLFLISIAVVALAACGGGGGSGSSGDNGDSGSGGGGPIIGPDTADVDAEVFTHKDWSALLSDEPIGNMSIGRGDDQTEIIDIDEYLCSNENFSLTETPEEFIAIQPDSSIVWLGNLIEGSSHLNVGSLSELPIGDRAPLGISIDLLTGDNYRLVENPSLITVNSAIGELIDSAIASGLEASSDAFYEYREAHSTEQTSLELGFAMEYMGATAEATLEIEEEANESTYYAYFIQRAFTVSIDLPDRPQFMFSDDFTQTELDQLVLNGVIGEENTPLYISNISYGRVLIYSMTSSYERERMEAAIEASYTGVTGGASGYTEGELEETLSEAKIKITTFGGDIANLEALIRTGDLGEYFSGDTSLSEMRPISFEVRRLADNEKADLVRTTEYTVKTCDFVGKTVPPIGDEIVVYFDSVLIPLDCDNGVDTGEIFGRFTVINNAFDVETVYEIPREAPVNVSSGNSLNIGRESMKLTRYYDQNFSISATLSDRDSGANGADDKVGDWFSNQFSIANQEPGTYTKTAINNCGGSNPTLTYRISREANSFIYQ